MAATYNTTDNKYLQACDTINGGHWHARTPGQRTSLCGVRNTFTVSAGLDKVSCPKCLAKMQDDKLAAAQMIADALRTKNTLQRDEDMQGEVWDRIMKREQQALDDITIYEDWQGFPSVGWEVSGQEWALSFKWQELLDSKGMHAFVEPYYTFLLQVFEA